MPICPPIRLSLNRCNRFTRFAGTLWIPGVLFAVFSNSAFAQFGGPAQVEVRPVERKIIAPTVRLVGTLEPQRRSILATEVAGAVVELAVDVGDHVKRGDLIARLRDSTMQFDLAAAEARVAEWQAELSINEADLAKAKFEKDRIERLGELSRSTEKEMIDARADFDAAAQRKAQTQAKIAAAQAEVDLARDRLERTKIVAPFDGFVVRKGTELGQWVNEGGAVIDLVDLSVLRARVNVHESALRFCKVGSNVPVIVEALEQTLHGTLARVVPDANQQARTFPVEVDVQNEEGLLGAGMFVRAAMPSGPPTESLYVAKDAVIIRGTAASMWLVRPNDNGHFASPMPVEIVAESAEGYAVQAHGLNVGDLTIIRGNEGLYGPGPVVIRNSPSPPTAKSNEINTEKSSTENTNSSSERPKDANAASSKKGNEEPA